MRTSFHHQPEAQHQIFSYQQERWADYPIISCSNDNRFYCIAANDVKCQ
jgi:hypothetical protein